MAAGFLGAMAASGMACPQAFTGAMGWELITRRDTVRNNGVGMAEGWECLFKREIENVRQSPQEKTALQEAAAEPRGKKS